MEGYFNVWIENILAVLFDGIGWYSAGVNKEALGTAKLLAVNMITTQQV